MSTQQLDVVVIGSGAAGLAAAETVAKAGLRCVSIDKMGPGGELMNLGPLQSYGEEEELSGPDLIGQLADRAMTAGAEIAIDDVSAVSRGAAGLIVEALEGTYLAKAVIVASGLTPGTTGLGEEARFEGLGLSHCAHCDAPLYVGKPVIVAGQDAWALEEAIELATQGALVILVVDGKLKAQPSRVEAYEATGNGVTMEGRVVGLAGRESLEAVAIRSPGGEASVPANGLFLQTGRLPAHAFLAPGLGEGDGVWLAGDVREGATRTVVGAIADGARAGHNAVAWIKSRQSA